VNAGCCRRCRLCVCTVKGPVPSPRGGLHGRIEETALLPRAPSSSSPSAAASERIFGASYVMRGSLSASELAEFGTTLMQSGALVSTNLFGPRNDSVNGPFVSAPACSTFRTAFTASRPKMLIADSDGKLAAFPYPVRPCSSSLFLAACHDNIRISLAALEQEHTQ
jgi:hypothetical protein